MGWRQGAFACEHFRWKGNCVEDLQDAIEYRMLQSKLAPRANVGRNLLLSTLMFWRRLIGCDGISSSSKPTKFLKDLGFVTQRNTQTCPGAGQGHDPIIVQSAAA